jgi:hypothetical protein
LNPEFWLSGISNRRDLPEPNVMARIIADWLFEGEILLVPK